MARQAYGFFDSIAQDDRDYADADFSRAFRILAGDGVRALGDNLRVISAQDGLHTRVLYGAAMCQGYYYELVDDGGDALTLAHDAAPSLPRVDRVVLRLDKNSEARTVTLGIRQGVAATSPEAPALVRDDTIYELSLAQVRIAVGAGIIADTDITDERADESVCGPLSAALIATHSHDGVESVKIACANLTGVLPISKGGFGATTKEAAIQALFGTEKSTPNWILTLGSAGLADGGGYSTMQQARNALGLGNTTGPVPIANGGLGTTTAAGARAALGLGNTTGPVPLSAGGTGGDTAVAAVAGLFPTEYPNPSYFMTLGPNGYAGGGGWSGIAYAWKALVPQITYSSTTPTGSYDGQLWLKPV